MPDELSDRELDTYSRQIALADVGYEGQLKLRNSTATLVGVGGLGSPTAMKLAAMGVGRLRIIDRDVVSRSDLHRQYLYDTSVLGYAKVEAAAEKLSKLNPDIEIQPVAASLGGYNAEELLRGSDVVIDGLDQMGARYLINRTCVNLKMPYIFGAAIEEFGNATTIIPGKTPCLECFYQGLKDNDLPKCAAVGVHPAALGIISSAQVAEATRILTGKEPNLAGKLLYVNLKDLSFDKIEISRLPECQVCGVGRQRESVDEVHFEEGCARDGRRIFVITPKEKVEVDLGNVIRLLEGRGARLQVRGQLGITCEYDGTTLSFLRSGIMIAQVPPGAVRGDPKSLISKLYEDVLVSGLNYPKTIVPVIV